MSDNSHPDDQSLFKAIQNDNHEAFSTLYYRYHKPIYIYLLKVVKLESVAEDLTADVFLRLWEVRKRIAIQKSFEAYLYKISRNIAYRKLSEIITDRKAQQLIIQKIEGFDFQNTVVEKEYNTLLNEAIQNLPPQRRRVFELCRIQGFSYNEVSEQLGISRNTIKQHMTEAMKYIEQYFADKGGLVMALLILAHHP